MPTYVYWCATCRRQFEKVMPVSKRATSRPVCPECKGRKVQPIITGFYAKTSRKS